MKRLVVIGAGGDMMSSAVCALARFNDLHLVLVDRDADALTRVAASIAPRSAETTMVDLFDRSALVSTITGADLVLNGAGPFSRTAEDVVRACIAARVDYLDIADDIEAIVTTQRLDNDARQAGVNVLIGCGVSPGLTNVMAAAIVDALDPSHPIDVDVAWLVGDEGEQRLGDAVMEHAIHMVSGQCLTWRNGAATEIPAFELADILPYAEPIGPARQWELAHPEVVTLPQHLPHVRSVRCFGSLRPESTNGVLRGLGRAVHEGELDLSAAARFLGSVLSGGNGNIAGWKAARRGLRDQVRRGELTKAQYRRFWTDGLRKRHEPFVGGFLARATGSIDGRPITLIQRSGRSGPDTGIPSMAHVTGHAAAAFARLALEQRASGGVRTPEAWAPLADLQPMLQAVGLPDDLIEPVFEVQ